MSKVKASEDSENLKFSESQVHKETDNYKILIANFKLDDINFFATYFQPAKVEKPRALVFICHGYAEYISASYDEICGELASNGILAFGHDHRGHGKTGGERVHVNSMDDYVKPMLMHIRKVSKDYNDQLPIFAIGHSMGGLITAYAGIEGQDLFKGLIFMGPLIKMNPAIATPVNKMLAGVMQCIAPKFSLGYLDHEAITRDKGKAKLRLSAGSLFFQFSKIWLHFSAVCERVKEDQLIWHGGFRAKHSHVLLQTTDAFKEGQLLQKIKVPILIFQGLKDRLVEPEGSTYLHENVSSEDKKLLTYPEAFHNLYVELDDVKKPVIKETCEWINQRI